MTVLATLKVRYNLFFISSKSFVYLLIFSSKRILLCCAHCSWILGLMWSSCLNVKLSVCTKTTNFPSLLKSSFLCFGSLMYLLVKKFSRAPIWDKFPSGFLSIVSESSGFWQSWLYTIFKFSLPTTGTAYLLSSCPSLSATNHSKPYPATEASFSLLPYSHSITNIFHLFQHPYFTPQIIFRIFIFLLLTFSRVLIMMLQQLRIPEL